MNKSLLQNNKRNQMHQFKFWNNFKVRKKMIRYVTEDAKNKT